MNAGRAAVRSCRQRSSAARALDRAATVACWNAGRGALATLAFPGLRVRPGRPDGGTLASTPPRPPPWPQVEAALGDVRTEVRSGLESALDGAARPEELAALGEELAGKAPLEALRGLQHQVRQAGPRGALKRAARTGVRSWVVWGGCARAVLEREGEPYRDWKVRSLRLRPQVAALGAALANSASLAATAPPDGGERGGGAASGGLPSGPLVTKMRCLTCDQAITSPGPGSAGGARGERRKSGAFLPRLESMTGRDGLPGGPGVGVAELRRAAEEKLNGLAIGGTGARGGAGIADGEDERLGSPGRAVERSRAARTPVKAGVGKPVFV
jgi:hypothetical protein